MTSADKAFVMKILMQKDLPPRLMKMIVKHIFGAAKLTIAVSLLRESIRFHEAGDTAEAVIQAVTAIAMAGAAYKENPEFAARIVTAGSILIDRAHEVVQVFLDKKT